MFDVWLVWFGLAHYSHCPVRDAIGRMIFLLFKILKFNILNIHVFMTQRTCLCNYPPDKSLNYAFFTSCCYLLAATPHLHYIAKVFAHPSKRSESGVPITSTATGVENIDGKNYCFN